MKFKLSNNSTFAVLLRSPWWISAALALLMVTLTAALVPTYIAVGVFAALPFAVIAIASAWKRRKLPSGSRVERTLETVRAMSWNEFANVLESALRHDGCDVERLGENAADFKLSKRGRISVVSAKRWKTARVGVEPLRELLAARDRHDAMECMFVVTGEITDNAAKFATANRIQLVDGTQLAILLPRLRQP